MERYLKMEKSNKSFCATCKMLAYFQFLSIFVRLSVNPSKFSLTGIPMKFKFVLTVNYSTLSTEKEIL